MNPTNKTSIIELMQEAYALHEMIFDEKGAAADYIFLEGNKKFEELTGLIFDDIKNKRVLQILPNTDPELIKKYGEVVKTGDPMVSIVHVKEIGRYFRVSAHKIGNKFFSTLFMDVTDSEENKKALEEQIKKNELLIKEYQTVFNATQELMFLLEVVQKEGTGKKNFVYLRTNSVYHQKTGIPFEAVYQKTPEEIFGEDRGAMMSSYYLKCLRQQKNIKYQQTHDLPGGRFTFDIELFPIKEGHEIKYIVGSAEDITEKIQREEELKKAKEAAEAASKSKSIFLANMSHEIRTPMNGIIGTSHIMKNELLGPNKEELVEYLDDIQDSAKDLLRIINDILDYSDLELGKTTLEEKPVNLQRILLEAERYYQEEVAKKSITFATETKEGYQDLYLGDEGKLKQILLHIIGNAVKYTTFGEIRVTLESVKEKNEEKELVKVTVADTGIGIPEDKKDKIFQGFTQLEELTIRNYKGAGLGLSIVKGFLDLMGGTVRVENSDLDLVGTSFIIEIPLVKMKNQENKKNQDKSSSKDVPSKYCEALGQEISLELIDKIFALQDKVIHNKFIEEEFFEKLAFLMEDCFFVKEEFDPIKMNLDNFNYQVAEKQLENLVQRMGLDER